jgi:GNAT superfamily N-acetyltransferase
VDALRAIQADSRSWLLVLESEGRVAATATLYIVPNLSHGGRPFMIVESVVVDEANRGSGFGRVLMDEAEARARAANCYKIAFTSNRRRVDAHRFYERLGYRATHQGFTKYFDLLPPGG